MIKIPLNEIYVGMMVLMRLTGIIVMTPFLSSKSISLYLRGALLVGLAVILYPLVSWEGEIPMNMLEWGFGMGKELLVGLIMGMAVRMVFFLVEFSGNLIMEESGLMRSDSFDPISSTRTSTLSTLFFYLSTLIFFILQVDHDMFLALLKSYDYVPIGISKAGIGGLDMMIKGSAEVFLVSIKMAAPVLAINFTLMMTFSIMGKAAPKIEVFSTSFAARIVVGFSMLLLTFELIALYLTNEIRDVPERMLRYLLNY